MLDIKRLREDPEPFRVALARRDLAERVDELLAADARRRELTTRVEDLRAEQNKASKAIGAATGDEKQRLIDEVGSVSAEIKELEPQLAEAEVSLDALLAATPNLPDESAPDGGEDDAVEIRRNHDEPPSFDFEVRDHVALGELLGVLDVDRGARTSGSRFVYLLGDIVLLQFALVRSAMDILMQEDFTPVIPPVLVREEAMYGTGFLPADEVNIYRTEQDELYLVGTAEVPLAALHMGEIIEESQLPLRYAGYSTCFRREAGSYGKDLGGMFRVHQFDKVEMFMFTTPEGSKDAHEFLLGVEEKILGKLEIPYRVVNIAVGDLGAPATKKYDIEGWLPAQERYRELTSCSNTTDYQARRLQTRVRRADGSLETLHTLNGTATAIGRTLIAILENHQRADGSVEIPEHLWQYLPERVRVLEPTR
ncbi:MAG: serine--tRNA ligase [Actinomycetota bacterium]|nr:serine--tRNA ligase [Actinomycetota bacterium]